MEVDFLCSVCRDRKGTFELLSISRTCKTLDHSLARLLADLRGTGVQCELLEGNILA